jgi:hypothetical protein
MADYTKREMRNVERGEHLARLQNARYTLFPNDYDPQLTFRGLTVQQAVHKLEQLASAKVFLYRAADGLWGYGVETPVVQRFLGTSSGGKMKFSMRSTTGDAEKARIELGHMIVLGGIGCFRGLPNLTFEANLKKLRSFVSLPAMAPADQFNAAKDQLLPRDLMNLGLYGTRMRENILRAR